MLEISAVEKNYDHPAGQVHVLKGIDLKIVQGEVVAIVGPSGAGKSTLLHILGGLDVPASGEVVFEGENIYKLSEVKRAQIRNLKMGFIFQFYHLLPEFTALENVILPALVDKNVGSMDSVKAKAVLLLDRVGLNQRYEHKPHELSGGEQQRVAIARALINEPKVIFCDEPTGNLDSESGTGVIDLLMELNQKNRQTLVIVTHDEQIAKRSHRVVKMRDGKLV
jgi:lipoprotein-releasing system ATP-binding protein